jgi:hypothetical protein
MYLSTSLKDLAESLERADVSFCRFSLLKSFNKLKEIGFIRHVGPTKAGRWEVGEGIMDAMDGGEVGGRDE